MAQATETTLPWSVAGSLDALPARPLPLARNVLFGTGLTLRTETPNPLSI